MEELIGIDIGGTTSAVLLGDVEGGILDKIAFATRADKGPNYTLQKIYNGIEQILENNSLSPEGIACIGVSCGGPLDSKRGLIMSPPNLPGWDRIAIVEKLEERFNIDTYLENDANASALAEWKFGAGQGYSDLIFLTFGTGLGAGLILNGQLYRGGKGLAGEVGHIRLRDEGPVGHDKAGSFEGFCSGNGLVNLARIIIEKKQELGIKTDISNIPFNKLTARDIGIAAEEGDHIAREILGISGKYLGYGLAILIDIFNPEVIIIGSIYHRCQQFLEPPARRVLSREALPVAYKHCQLNSSDLKEKIGDYASLAVGLNYLKSSC